MLSLRWSLEMKIFFALPMQEHVPQSLSYTQEIVLVKIIQNFFS